MFRWPRHNARSLSGAIFAALSITVIITILVLSMVLYQNFQDIVLYYIYTSEKNNILHISYSANVMTDLAATFATQMYSDPNIYALLRKKEPTGAELTQGTSKLLAFRNSSSSFFFHSIYVVNTAAQKVYVASPNMYDRQIQETSSFYDSEALDLIGQFAAYSNRLPISRSVTIPGYSSTVELRANVFTFVFSDMQRSDGSIGSALIFNINEDWIKNAMSTIDKDSGYRTMIVNRDGVVVSSDGGAANLTDLSGEPYVRHILEEKTPTGYFVDQVGGAKSLIIYTRHAALGWTFVRILPYGTIQLRVESAKARTINIGLMILLLGMAVSFVCFLRLRKPIQFIFQQMRNLEEEIAGSQYMLQQNSLRRLIFTETDNEVPRQLAELRGHGVLFPQAQPFALALLRIDGYTSYWRSHSLAERSLLKHRLMRLAQQALPPEWHPIAVDMEDDRMVLLSFVDDPSRLGEPMRGLIARTREELSLSLSICIHAKPACWDQALRTLYDEALAASAYRVFYGPGRVLSTRDAERQEEPRHAYARAKEADLIDALYRGKADEMRRVYADMIAELLDKPIEALNATLMHLSFALSNAMDELEKNSGVRFSVRMTAFVAELNKKETLADIEAHFFRLFDTLLAEIRKQEDGRQERLIERIEACLSEDIGNPALSVELLADRLGFTSVYFGRLFRKLYGKPFLSYIADIRMELARKLLASTDLSNEDIAIKVGFSTTTYFYKVFKKTHGTTPNVFRTHLKQQKRQDHLPPSPPPDL